MIRKKFRVKVVSKLNNKEQIITVKAPSENHIRSVLGCSVSDIPMSGIKSCKSGEFSIKNIEPIEGNIEKKLKQLNTKPIEHEDILKLLSFISQTLSRGVSLKKSLEFLRSSEGKGSVRKLIDKMLECLEKQFANYYEIFRLFPRHFDHILLGMVRAGESTGTLPENILQYVKDQQKIIKQKREISRILFKRLTLLTVVIIVALVIVSFVIPQFVKLFESSDKIPDLLRRLSVLSDFLNDYGLYITISICLILLLSIYLLKNNYRIKKTIDNLLLKIPVINDVIRTFFTTQYLYFTGTLLIRNVNFVKIMNIVINQTQNIPFKEIFELIKSNLLRGIKLEDMLKNESSDYAIPKGYLLSSLTQAIEMGSATGNMGEVLFDAYLTYDNMLQEKIHRAIKLFDRLFYGFIIILMGTLFYAMGSAMAALYQNTGNLA